MKLIRPHAYAFALLALTALLGPARLAAQSSNGWSVTWGSSQEQPYGTEVLPPGSFEHATLREVVHLSSGASHIRLRLTNLFGEEALQLESVHVALRTASMPLASIDPATDREVTFNGKPGVQIPVRSEFLSDPLAIALPPRTDLVVTMSIVHAPETLTLHAGARATAFIMQGNHVADATFSSPKTITRWYFLTAIETQNNGSSVVALGDSITDGHGATTDGNDRWTDVLAQRLGASAATQQVGVVNEGIGGNHLLTDGIGPNALSRFDRDVLLPGVRNVIIFEGVNDLGGLDIKEEHPQAAHDALVQQLETVLAQMVSRAHERGIRVIGGTITPYGGSGYYHPGAVSEADRKALNQWIRQPGTFDGVVDFDAAVRDPAKPDHLLPAFDSGDHLHPGPAGYKAMGDAVPLALLNK